MRIAILGAGAIGSLVGGYLLHNGADVTFIMREGERANRWRDNGFTLQTLDGERLQLKPPILTDTKKAPRFDLVIITVKTYSLKDALSTHETLVKGAKHLLTLQNGIGNAETLMDFTNRNDIMAGSITAGAYIEGNELIHAGAGDIVFGCLDGQARDAGRKIEAVLNHAEENQTAIHARFTTTIKETLFLKLAVNCALNPVTALLKVPNGALGENALAALVRPIVDEVAQIAKAEGLKLDEEILRKKVYDVASLTKENRSSMLKDVLAKRPTEIDAINGALSALGEKHAIATPVNDALAALIRAHTETAALRVE